MTDIRMLLSAQTNLSLLLNVIMTPQQKVLFRLQQDRAISSSENEQYGDRDAAVNDEQYLRGDNFGLDCALREGKGETDSQGIKISTGMDNISRRLLLGLLGEGKDTEIHNNSFNSSNRRLNSKPSNQDTNRSLRYLDATASPNVRAGSKITSPHSLEISSFR